MSDPNKQKLCHGGLLRNNTQQQCYVEAGWRRVCAKCMAEKEVSVDPSRCRVLSQPVGQFSSGRTYYIQWSLTTHVACESVRPFKLVDGTGLLLIFPTAEDARRCDVAVQGGLLCAANPQQCTLRMCATSKSFCPAQNFLPAIGATSAPSSCAVHLPLRPGSHSELSQMRQSNNKMSSSSSSSSNLMIKCAPCAPVVHCEATPLETATPLQLTAAAYSGSITTTATAALSQPLMANSTLPLLMAPHAAGSARSGTTSHDHTGIESRGSSVSVPGSSSPHSQHSASGYDESDTLEPVSRGGAYKPHGANKRARGAAQQQELTTDVPRAAAAAAANDHQPPNSGLLGASSEQEHGAEDGLFGTEEMLAMYTIFDDDEGEQPPQGQQPSPPLPLLPLGGSARYGKNTGIGGLTDSAASAPPARPSYTSDLGNAHVHGTLIAHGETLKASGSAMWTVLSDARLKDVVGDFPLGITELMKLRPRVFKYNGLAGVHGGGRAHVGIIAQEVPPSLRAYCCHRASVLLHKTDAQPTEVLMLDHTSFTFLCINALQDHEERLSALESSALRLPGQSSGLALPGSGGTTATPSSSSSEVAARVQATRRAGVKADAASEEGAARLLTRTLHVVLLVASSLLTLATDPSPSNPQQLPPSGGGTDGGGVFVIAATASRVLAPLWGLSMLLKAVVGPRLAARLGCSALLLLGAFWALHVASWHATHRLSSPPLRAIPRGRSRVPGSSSVSSTASSPPSLPMRALAELLPDSLGGDRAGTFEAALTCACLGAWLGCLPSAHLSLKLKLLTATLLDALPVCGVAIVTGLQAVRGHGSMAWSSAWALCTRLPHLPFLGAFLAALIAERLTFQRALLQRLAFHLGVMEEAHDSLLTRLGSTRREGGAAAIAEATAGS